MGKTPEYVLKAIHKYNSKFDRITINLPKGTKDLIIQLTDKSCSQYILDLIKKDLYILQNEK